MATASTKAESEKGDKTEKSEKNPSLFVAYLCFFLSGISGLIYEVAWLNRVQLIMGHTVYSMTTTIVAYMAGLALGSLWVPRLLKTGISSLTLYLIAEVAIGIYGLVFYPLLQWMQIPYDAIVTQFDPSLLVLNLIQLVFCGSLVIVPTFLMGTTLPLLTDYISKEKGGVAASLPGLYGINTLGAACGALLAGLAILPALGYFATVQLTAGINFTLFLIASLWLTNLKLPNSQDFRKLLRAIFSPGFGQDDGKRGRKLEGGDIWACWILFISGFVCTILQLIWNRIAALTFGPSVYIFPIVTAAVLLGMVLGSWLAHRAAKADPARFTKIMTVLPFLAAVFVHLGTYAFTQSPPLVYWINKEIAPNFLLLNILEFLWLGVCLLPAGMFMGALFPIASIYLTAHKTSTRAVAALSFGYSLNIVGLIFGSIVGAFFLLPHLGIEKMALVIFALLALTSFALSLFLGSQRISLALGFAACSFIVFNIIPPYDWNLLTAGYFYNRLETVEKETLEEKGWFGAIDYLRQHASVLKDHRDDPHATISIHQSTRNSERWLFKINGKVDGSTIGDLGTTRLLALLPGLVRPDAEDTLIIGLGVGSTAANSLRLPKMKFVKMIELSPAMIDFSRKYFRGVDGDIWSDRRFVVENRDGRDFLQHTKETYDIIISEPSNPWVDGVASLFTKEYFHTISTHLKPRGVGSLWFHTYGLDCTAIYSVLKAAAEVFPAMIVLKVSGDLYMLAANSKDVLKLKPFPEEAASLEAILLAEGLENQSVENKSVAYETFLKESFLYDRNSILNTEFYTPANLDDNQILQFRSGKSFFRNLGCKDFPNSGSSRVALSYLVR